MNHCTSTVLLILNVYTTDVSLLKQVFILDTDVQHLVPVSLILHGQVENSDQSCNNVDSSLHGL